MKRTPLRSRRAPKRTRRPAAERERIYGPATRRGWVCAQPCVVCRRTPCENCHTETGGVGRKGDAETIVPMCHMHHREQHSLGIRSFEARYNIDLELAAIATEQAWQAYQARNPEHVSSVVKRVMEDL